MSGWTITIALFGGPLDGIRAQTQIVGMLDEVWREIEIAHGAGRYVKQRAANGAQMHTTDGAFVYGWEPETLPKDVVTA